MATVLDSIKEANTEFLKVMRSQGGLPQIDKQPSKHVAIISCMDTRLLYILEPALGLMRGSAVMIKIAGSRITESFDSAIGSLLVAVYELGVTEIIVITHEDCGMAHTTASSLCEKMKQAGVAQQDIDAIKPQLEVWTLPESDATVALNDIVERLKQNPYLPKTLTIHGCTMNPNNGKIHFLENK
ncbi:MULTISPECIES: carbonic anhydrase [Megasphaera]|jgi:hypothetical protein|uniref:carbonic anhydrase n=1 Tax=Megasphaera hutchinsoni TaxID=1588748 RepID=A0A2J8B9Y3_9FIRM|nr:MULTISPECIES: carbonic anhydrase [Megasphaera]EGS36359.1 carbonate dehydratase [Megasphaera sp. UPII 135-E]MUP48992.1 carbonic anhydrase [Veillonellaceae bacterium M2-8]PNH21575.1 carbonic anhydrase [Megasphaera genomosp. type_2]